MDEYFHPDLEQVLLDIAKDPEAKLLRVPRSGDIVRMMCAEEVSIAAPGLTTAEQHLLEVHREEVAWLLRQRCLIEFYSQPDADVKWNKNVTIDRELEIPEKKDWEERTHTVLVFETTDERSSVGTDVLARCVGGDEPVRIAQLATASLRVKPSDQARMYLAMNLADTGRDEDAVSSYEMILGGKPNRLLRSVCWNTIGTLLCRSGKANEALAAHRESTTSHGPRINPLIDCIPLLILGDKKGVVLDACKQLDDVVSSNHSSLSSFEKVFAARTYWGLPDFNDDQTRMGLELLDAVGGASRRIIHASIC